MCVSGGGGVTQVVGRGGGASGVRGGLQGGGARPAVQAASGVCSSAGSVRVKGGANGRARQAAARRVGQGCGSRCSGCCAGAQQRLTCVGSICSMPRRSRAGSCGGLGCCSCPSGQYGVLCGRWVGSWHTLVHEPVLGCVGLQLLPRYSRRARSLGGRLGCRAACARRRTLHSGRRLGRCCPTGRSAGRGGACGVSGGRCARSCERSRRTRALARTESRGAWGSQSQPP